MTVFRYFEQLDYNLYLSYNSHGIFLEYTKPFFRYHNALKDMNE